jgi:hypothetical protein
MADLFSDGLKYEETEKHLFNDFPLYPLYLTYRDKQVISIPEDPHADGNTKCHLEISSLFRAGIIE